MAKEEKNVSFEQALAQLEQIVSAIEGGQVGLEESLAKYEQGMALVKKCRTLLESAEKRIEMISQTDSGLTTAPLEETADTSKPE
ncbi:MAG: exodeoxyribonuclease VII small subunit [Phycisphaerae bacterium]